jgi:hypothetical protein
MEPVVSAVMLADTLIVQATALARRIGSSGVQVFESDDYELACGELERTYAAIWDHLDRARTLIGEAPGYDAVRAEEGPVIRGIVGVDSFQQRSAIALLAGQGPGATTMRMAHPNHPGLARAVRASVALKLATPAIDWAAAATEAAQPAERVGSGPKLRTVLIAVGAIALLAVGVLVVKKMPRDTHTVWVPAPSAPRMLTELRARLAAHPCESASAEQMIQLLQDFHQDDAALDVRDQFAARCQDTALAGQGHRPIPLHTLAIDGETVRLEAAYPSMDLFPQDELRLLVVPPTSPSETIPASVPIDSAALCTRDFHDGALTLAPALASRLSAFGVLAIDGDACPTVTRPTVLTCTSAGCRL